MSRHDDVAKAIDYMLKRWAAFTRFLDDGRICLTNNAAERGLRGIALGRRSWLFAGSDRGGQRAAKMYSLVITARMNDVDPQAWLAGATLHQDTWWNHWVPWIAERAGAMVRAPREHGSARFPVLGDAPGTYVRRDA